MIKFIKNNLIALLMIAIFPYVVYALDITPNFPGSLNNFEEGEIIEEEDFNAIEYTIGETSTTSKSTLHGKWNDLFASSTMPQLTTLLNLISVGTLTTGTWNATPIDISSYTNLTTDAKYLVLNGDNLEFSTSTQNLFTTGWISGGELTIDGVDPTKFDVAAGTGLVCDNHTDATNPSCTVVSWDAFNDQSLTTPGQLVTRIGIDENGALVQSFLSPLFTREQQRDYISLGAAVHLTGSTIDFFTDSVDVVNFNPALNLRDLASSLGTSVNIEGIEVTGSTGLGLQTSSGSVYAPGLNRSNTKDPNVATFTASTTLNWQYSYRDSTNPPLNYSLNTSTTTLVVNRYDDGTGATGGIPNGIVADNRYSIQRAYLLGSTGQWFVEYGQDTYASFSEAEKSINTETFSQNPVLGALAFRGWIILKGDATDVTDDDQVRFLNADRFGDLPLNYGIEDGVANIHNFANGVIITQHTASTTSDGSTVTLNIANSVGGNGTVQFHQDNHEILMPTSTPLTAGTNSVPVTNYVYFEGTEDANHTVLITANTTGFPTDGTLYAPVGTYTVQSAENVQAIGGLYKEHLYDNSLGNGQGNASDIPNRIRREHAVWESGVALTTNGSGTSNVTIETTSGLVWQVHLDTMPAIASTTPFKVKNDSVSAYATTTNLADLDSDSLGNTLIGKYYYLTIWGIRSQNSGSSGLYINLPNTSFLNLNAAQAQPTAFDATIPNWARGTGFLIAKLLVNQSLGGVLTVNNTTDLRGQDPGGVSGGSGINTPTDFSDGASGFTIFNVTDSTKELQWDVSGITTGTARTLSVQDSNGTIALLGTNQLFTGNNVFNGANDFTQNLDVLSFSATSTTATSTISYDLDVNNIQLVNGGYIWGDTTNPFIKLNASSGTMIGYDGTETVYTMGNIQHIIGLSEIARWTATGLGIGTTSPYAKLSVVGETVSEYFTATSTTASSTLPQLETTTLNVATAIEIAGEYISNFTTYVIGIIQSASSVIITGAWDYGGATSLEIPNGSSPTVDAVGEIALQTSPEDAIIVATSTNATYPGILPISRNLPFNYASSTWTSTTTIGYPTLDYGERVTSGICYTDAGTVLVRVGDGTNWSNVTSVGTATTSVNFTSNNVFNRNGEKLLFEVGTPASSPTQIKCNFRRYYE